MAKKSKSKKVLHLDKTTGNYTGEIELSGNTVPVTASPDDESKSVEQLELLLKSFVQNWLSIRKKVVSVSQKELRETGHIGAKAKLSDETLSVFSLSISPGEGEWFYSLGIELDAILGEDDYVDYSSDFHGTWHTVEVRSLL